MGVAGAARSTGRGGDGQAPVGALGGGETSADGHHEDVTLPSEDQGVRGGLRRSQNRLD